MSVRVSVCLSFCKKKFFVQNGSNCKFGEQTSRILEFKPEGLEGYIQYPMPTRTLWIWDEHNGHNLRKNALASSEITCSIAYLVYQKLIRFDFPIATEVPWSRVSMNSIKFNQIGR